MTSRLDHVNLVVRDLPAMVAFYRDALGMRVAKEVRIRGAWIDAVTGLRDTEAEVVYLDPGGEADADAGARIELIRFLSPAGGARFGDALGKPDTLGLRHLALRVQDIERWAERLRAAGVSLLSPVQRVPGSQATYAGDLRKWIVYFHDPEGNLLELCEYRPAGGDAC